MTFFETFNDGVFQEDFDSAFFKRGHVNILVISPGRVKRSGGRQFLADEEFIVL